MAKQRGEGTVYFEKNRNKWHAAIVDPQGERLHKRFDTEDEANAWRLELAMKFRKGTYIPKKDITVGEWIVQYLEVFVKSKVRAKTFNDYLDAAEHIDEEYASKLLQKVTPLETQMFLNNLDASVFIKEKVGKLIRRISKKAYVLNVIERDFTIGLEIPHPKKQKIEVFTVQEMQSIFAMLDENPRLRHHYLLVALALASGCRMGELLALTPDDITCDAINISKALVESKGKLYLVPPKTDAGYRSVTLPAPLMATLQYEASKREHDEYIFKNAKGNPCRTSNIGKSWQTILRYANIPHRKFHCLRHTHATMLLASGVPVVEVAKRLGHSRPSHTLNLYGHAVPGYDKKLPELVSQIFKIGNNAMPAEKAISPIVPCVSVKSETKVKPKDKFVAYVMKQKSPKN